VFRFQITPKCDTISTTFGTKNHQLIVTYKHLLWCESVCVGHTLEMRLKMENQPRLFSVVTRAEDIETSLIAISIQ